ncbi:putative RNA methyltransferase [Kushneria marisflavi]|uniref:rRNA (Guanine-N1)-methyltransferase n=1 Tax=Kushneria marisflavi TaxID=157779 RepID=A0A240UMA4_9GAMM|nr:methyltransferase domain-containing protein [Kushneria marisflavi]ART62256.1 rRNA (guanine-N1)-methyltransferase [Kushneria marisflavi]RKD87350.1 23S rRNA m(1)G-745 methyltransferase [Kushneria marisflavi]
MTIAPLTSLTCPLDGAPLSRTESGWCCPQGHTFDVSRQGHVNLLPVQKKRSRDPGDSKAMIAARRRFLEADHYQGIAEAVSRRVLAHGAAHEALAVLDAGCGEGYYLRALAQAASVRRLSVLGLDISKWAVQAAAGRDRRMQWVVGSNAALPVPDQSLDVVLCMFGFPTPAEFARVLKPGGLLLEVEAGPDHLIELREIIYPTLKAPREPRQAPEPGFKSDMVETVRYARTLSSREQILDLLVMTPHLYRATAEGRAKAEALAHLDVTVEARLTGSLRL